MLARQRRKWRSCVASSNSTVHLGRLAVDLVRHRLLQRVLRVAWQECALTVHKALKTNPQHPNRASRHVCEAKIPGLQRWRDRTGP